MKTMRKLLAMALVLMLALSLVPTAFADGTGKLTVTGTTNTTYTLYKICIVEPANNNTAKYIYKLTDEWTGFKADGYFDVVDGYVHWLKSTASASDGAAIAQLAKKYLTTSGSSFSSAGTVAVGGTIENLEDGYYLLVPDTESACGVVVVTSEKAATVTEKTSAAGLPSVTKKVLEDSTNTYGKTNHADIGETITFQTTITAGGNDSNYVLHDRMDEHLLWLGGGNVTRDGNMLARDTDYTVDDNPDDGCTFHVIFKDHICNSLNEGATLVVNYFAVLKDEIPKGDGTTEKTPVNVAHPNETWLTHTPQQVPTNHDSTETFTYKITVTKQDQDGNPLAGAAFVLRDNVNKYYTWGDITNNDKTTQGVTWGDLNNATRFETGADGIIEFYGVDAENFILEEVKVPGGYTGAGDVAVSTKGGNAEVTVTNTLGAALPETGGMGTTLFYLVGGLMVVAAVVLLVTKKRMRAAE